MNVNIPPHPTPEHHQRKVYMNVSFKKQTKLPGAVLAYESYHGFSGMFDMNGEFHYDTLGPLLNYQTESTESYIISVLVIIRYMKWGTIVIYKIIIELLFMTWCNYDFETWGNH